MKIGLIGYGRMGKAIEQIALQRGHEITKRVDIGLNDSINAQNVDCYIDFSVAEALQHNLHKVCSTQVPLVIGTTGWNKHLAEYAQLLQQSGTRAIWASNFSLGVNLFWKTIAQAASIFDGFAAQYDVFLHEYHHRNKIDSPSGTAITTAKQVLAHSSVKKRIVTDTLNRKIENDELHVTATRGGAVPGTHSVFFDSLFDTIEITHTARTREGFALGAVLAAENINKLDVGLHEFSDIFDRMFTHK